MWRLPFLNLTFMFLLLAIMTMQKLAPGTQHLESDLSEFSEGAPQVRAHSVRLDARYLSQLSAFFTDIADHLAQVWQRAEILAEWPIENDTAHWYESYAPTSVEKDLIEARFHVENAEVYVWSIKNRQKTMAELNQAERFVQNARPLIKRPALMTIDAVTKELEIMKSNIPGEGASRPANYETVKTDLDRVIDWVRTTGRKKAPGWFLGI
jgi:hypothetical protein